jgi:hypothetical protein
MFRKAFLLTLVVGLIGSDSAFARHGRRRCLRQECVTTCCRPCVQCGSNKEQHGSSKAGRETYHREYYCLQDLWFDYPGDFDIWICQVHESTCPNPNFYDDLWYGEPEFPAPRPDNASAPQDCSSQHPCEYIDWGEGGGPAPGHGKRFTTKDEVYNWIKANLAEGATLGADSKYYAFQHNGQSWVGVVVAITGRNSGTKNLCLLTGLLPGEPVAPTAISASEQPKLNSTRTVLRIRYNDGEPRKALIWMKAPVSDLP